MFGDPGAFVERNVIVVNASENHLRAQAAFEQLAQALGDFEHQVFFQQALTANGSQIPAAVARINDDAHLRYARPQLQIFARRRRDNDR